MSVSVDHERVPVLREHFTPYQIRGMRIALPEQRQVVISRLDRVPVNRGGAEQDADLSLARQPAIHGAPGPKEFRVHRPVPHRRGRYRVLEHLAHRVRRHVFTLHVAVDDVLIASAAALNDDVVHGFRETTVTNEPEAKGEALLVAVRTFTESHD